MSSASSAFSLADLPLQLQLSILSFLPSTVDRVRCALGANLKEALRAPAFWDDLSFEGANSTHVTPEVILALCRRSSEQGPRLLDLSADCCVSYQKGVWPPRSVVGELLSSGLLANVESLATGRMWFPRLDVPSSARSLRDGCPKLISLTTNIEGGWHNVTTSMRILACSGGRSEVTLCRDAGGMDRFPGFASALADALPHFHVDTLTFSPLGQEEQDGRFNDSVQSWGFGDWAAKSPGSDPAAVDVAAARLGGRSPTAPTARGQSPSASTNSTGAGFRPSRTFAARSLPSRPCAFSALARCMTTRPESSRWPLGGPGSSA